MEMAPIYLVLFNSASKSREDFAVDKVHVIIMMVKRQPDD